MNKNNHLVIMAGGIGSRFWPISTTSRPKQFIDILSNGKTLIQETVERFKGICPSENVWVVTSEQYAEIAKKQLPDIPEENILLEPCQRNTAPCIAYATWRIMKRNPDANIIVTPSDHYVADKNEFRKIISTALDFITDNDVIVTIGITPSRPDTGYGYIEAEQNSSEGITKVRSFKEKPDLDTAKEYIAQSNYMWNSGIFAWNAKTISSAITRFEPKIAEIFEGIKEYLGTDAEHIYINEHFPNCRNISIDYAVLERADNVFVCPANFGWNDLGTWGSLYDFIEHDDNGNAKVESNIIMEKTTDCIVHTLNEKKVVLIGVKNCIIAEHNGYLLICDKENEHLIKQFSE